MVSSVIVLPQPKIILTKITEIIIKKITPIIGDRFLILNFCFLDYFFLFS